MSSRQINRSLLTCDRNSRHCTKWGLLLRSIASAGAIPGCCPDSGRSHAKNWSITTSGSCWYCEFDRIVVLTNSGVSSRKYPYPNPELSPELAHILPRYIFSYIYSQRYADPGGRVARSMKRSQQSTTRDEASKITSYTERRTSRRTRTTSESYCSNTGTIVPRASHAAIVRNSSGIVACAVTTQAWFQWCTTEWTKKPAALSCEYSPTHLPLCENLGTLTALTHTKKTRTWR